MIALIDADIVAYRCSAVTENEPEATALFQTEALIKRIVEETQADSYISFLTGENNFRYKVNPEYKANRKDKPKPKHLVICREFIMKYCNGSMCDGFEADDAMGIHQDSEGFEYGDGEKEFSTVICTIDKDLLMVPGLHYNFVKKEFRLVSVLDGIRHMYYQMIMGDGTDGIFGFDGIARKEIPKKFYSMFEEFNSLTTEQDMFNYVLNLYDYDIKRFLMNADCLWMQRNVAEKYSDRKEPEWLAMKLQEMNLSLV